MPRATSISLAKFTATVNAAVKAAVEKHPKFKLEPAGGLAISYLIRGIPVPELIAQNVTLRETQAFATDVAAHIGREMPNLAETGRLEGALFSHGNHLIIGIPAPIEFVMEK